MDSTQAVASRAGLAPAAGLFRSLGDPARLAIVRRLAAGPGGRPDRRARPGPVHRVRAPGLPAGLRPGRQRAQGRASLWFLTQPALPALLAAAEDLLRQTGNAVALCPSYGQGR